jgi:hypothetical protein
MELLQFEAVGPEQERYLVKVDVEETTDERAVDITYSIRRREERPTIAKINFDLREGVVHMTGLEVALTGYLACLVTCGLGHLVEEILDCWRKGHRSPRQLLKCLRDKGISITHKLLNCSVACLGGVVVGAP